MITDPFLNYFALGLLFFAVIVILSRIIVPYLFPT